MSQTCDILNTTPNTFLIRWSQIFLPLWVLAARYTYQMLREKANNLCVCKKFIGFQDLVTGTDGSLWPNQGPASPQSTYFLAAQYQIQAWQNSSTVILLQRSNWLTQEQAGKWIFLQRAHHCQAVLFCRISK